MKPLLGKGKAVKPVMSDTVVWLWAARLVRAFPWSLFPLETGLRRHRALAVPGERGPGGTAELCQGGGRLLHPAAAAISGFCHQSLRAARRGHVRLHMYVRL